MRKIRKIFYSFRMGLIDVGHSSADSVNIWSHAKDRKKMLKVLSESTVVKGSDNKSESVAFESPNCALVQEALLKVKVQNI